MAPKLKSAGNSRDDRIAGILQSGDDWVAGSQ
jgi:hypothetical protein